MRNRHTMLARGSELWLFGGQIPASRGARFVSDVYRIDMSDWLSGEVPPAWEGLATDGFVPHARGHACLVALPPPRPYLVAIGGGDGEADYADAYALNLHSNYWQRLTNLSETPVALTQTACTLVTFPPPRYATSSSATLGVITLGGFGGASTNRSEHSRLVDSFAVHLGPDTRAQAWRWASVRASGALPTVRMGHTLLAINGSAVITFGGSSVGRYLNDVVIGAPNRLHTHAHAAEAEADAQEQRALEDAGGGDGEVGEDADVREASFEEGYAKRMYDHEQKEEGGGGVEEEEEDVVVVSTRRTADKKKARRRKRKARGGGAGKDEL